VPAFPPRPNRLFAASDNLRLFPTRRPAEPSPRGNCPRHFARPAATNPCPRATPDPG